MGGRGARGGLLRARARAGAGAVGGEGAGDLLLLLVWLVRVLVWRRGGGNRRTLLWRGTVQTVRGSRVGQQRGRPLARHGDGPAGKIGELDTTHQVLGEPLHDVWGQAVGVCDDVGQVGREAAGGGRTIVLARLLRLQGPWLGRGEVRTAPLLLAVAALGRSRSLLLLLLLRWWRLLRLRLVVAGGAGLGRGGIAALRRVGGGSVGS